ncbi:hypothetical protein [uncultured Shewanella sp.]|uniref:hypothetical protein n=1 Tax=uncultured Shewanella sp. TaxID=173975 RepID=UPI0026318789|nr:hypothetical protein [uncultured Shewanella sp.]
MRESIKYPLILAALLLAGCGGGSDDSNNTTITDNDLDTEITSPKYTVSTTTTAGGQIAPTSLDTDGKVPAVFTITQDDGFEIEQISGCGGVLNDNTYTIDTVSNDCAVNVIFTEMLYTVSTVANAGGSISPSTLHTKGDEPAVFTITQNDGFEIEQVSGCAGVLSDNTYTIDTISNDCEVNVAFAKLFPNDDDAPTVIVEFPLKTSRASGDRITITGVANDVVGVKAVRVNGVDAEFIVSENSDSQQVKWQVDYMSSVDETVLIETEDIYGNINIKAAELTIMNESISANSPFVIDNMSSRMFIHEGAGEFFEVDLATKAIYRFKASGISSYNIPISYQEKTDSILYVDNEEYELRVVAISPVTARSELLMNYTLAVDTDLWSYGWVHRVDFSQEKEALFILFKYLLDDGTSAIKNMMLKLNMDTMEFVVVFDEKTLNNQYVYTHDFAYSSYGFVVLDDNWLGSRLLFIDYDGINMWPLETYTSLNMMNINVDDNNNVVVFGRDSIERINLETGIISIVSKDEDVGDLAIQQINYTDIDVVNNQLYLSDHDLNILMQVDLKSGDRSKFISDNVGGGDLLVFPSNIAIDDNKNIAYTLNKYDDNSETVKLMEIDLNTGLRENIYELDGVSYWDLYGMVFDQDSQIIYINNYEKVIAIDLNKKTQFILTSQFNGGGILFNNLSSIMLDNENNRLLAFDSSIGNLLAIDLSTGERSLVTSSALVENLKGIDTASLDQENQIIYMISENRNHVLQLDLKTNQVVKIFDSCEGRVFGDDILYSLSFNKENNALLLNSSQFMQYNFDTKKCNYINIDVSANAIDVNALGQFFSIVFSGLYQVDLETGSKVGVSMN